MSKNLKSNTQAFLKGGLVAWKDLELLRYCKQIHHYIKKLKCLMLLKVDGDLQRKCSKRLNKTRQIYSYLKKRSTSAKEKKVKSCATTWSYGFILGLGNLTQKSGRYVHLRYVDQPCMYIHVILFKLMISLYLLFVYFGK